MLRMYDEDYESRNQNKSRFGTTFIFVWLVLCIMSGMAFYCLFKGGRNIPYNEDWTLVAPFTGHEPDLYKWLWSQNNEHRVPLPRLILLGLLKVTGDFRAGMVFNVIALTVLSAVLIRTAQRLRGGRTILADAFFPIAFMHLGNWENLFWSWQLSLVLPGAILCLVGIVFVFDTLLSKTHNMILVGVSSILLLFCGAIGVIFSPFLFCWIIYCCFRTCEGYFPTKRHRSIGLASAILGIGVLILYFVGYEKPPWNPERPGFFAMVDTSTKLLAMGFGSGVKNHWFVFICLAVLTLLSTLYILLRKLIRSETLTGKQRVLGILLLLLNLVIVVAAIGWGRGASIPRWGLPARYTIFTLPVFVFIYLIWERFGSRRKVIQYGFLIAICLLIPWNTRSGFQWRDWYTKGMDSLEWDIATGASASVLAERHKRFLVHWWQDDHLATVMQMLQEAEIGHFRDMVNDGED